MEYLLKMMLRTVLFILEMHIRKIDTFPKWLSIWVALLYMYVHDAIQKKYFHHILTLMKSNDSQNSKNLNNLSKKTLMETLMNKIMI